MEYFCINRNGCFFRFAGKITPSHFTRCSFYSSLNELYEAVMQLEGLDLDEIEGCEYNYLQDSDTGFWTGVDMRGCPIDEGFSSEQQLILHIQNYESC